MQNKKLSEEIIKMAKKDQKARIDWLKSKNIKKTRLRILNTDKSNTKRAKEIIKKYEWPTFDLVGKRASKAFWLIVQHADKNPKFQARCLKLLKEAVKNKQAFPENEAYLTDRVLVNQNKKQKFGTQFEKKDNKFIPKPIINKKDVNKRRRAYNLDALEDNIRRMQKYREKNKNAKRVHRRKA